MGLIVIDESQFLKFDASNSSLENLVGIAEDTGCALGFIGNTELISKMNRYPRLVGRTMLNRIEVGFKEQTNQMLFRQAVSLLWQYQWTKEFTPLTDEILDELVRDSMYNVAILKALLMRIPNFQKMELRLSTFMRFQNLVLLRCVHWCFRIRQRQSMI